MKKGKLIGTLTLLSGVALTLAACGNSNSNNTSHPNFKESTPKKTIKDGGNVSVAVVTDTPFTGIFNDELSTNNTDSEVMQYGDESLFATIILINTLRVEQQILKLIKVLKLQPLPLILKLSGLMDNL